MSSLGKSLACAVVLAAGASGFASSSASAYVRTCSGAAASGCYSPDGDHSYIETRSSKSGAAANYICTTLIQGTTFLRADCYENTTFIRLCYYGGYNGHGFHYGSSNAWTVDGRDATLSDATFC